MIPPVVLPEIPAASYELRMRVVAEARSWKGTKFVHQGRAKGVATDCLMLVRCTGENVPAMDRVTPAQDRRFRQFYGRNANPAEMRACLETFLVEIPKEEATVGDVMWSHWGDEMPIHMAIIAPYGVWAGLIHAVWPHDVSDCILTTVFTDRVTAYWRYPYIAELDRAGVAA